VPEYGRSYYEGRMHTPDAGEWTTSEFVHIARSQQRLEDALARRANRVLVCDTDALATCLWHERYVGTWSEEVERVANERRYDLYLLTCDEIAFEQDGMRDGEHIRHAMHVRFDHVLTERGHRWVLVTGSRTERLEQATRHIDEVLRPALGAHQVMEGEAK
jgi:nicotinamide riboside kinase